MTRQRPNPPDTSRTRRSRSGGAAGDGGGRTRPRAGGDGDAVELSDEELRALLDDNVDPDEVARVARDAEDTEQEASDHDRDTARDRIEGLLLEQDGEDF